jgi:hypothetical protein
VRVRNLKEIREIKGNREDEKFNSRGGVRGWLF